MYILLSTITIVMTCTCMYVCMSLIMYSYVVYHNSFILLSVSAASTLVKMHTEYSECVECINDTNN